MFIYQERNRYFAQCADDIKEIAQEELVDLGGSDLSPTYRGIYFNADLNDIYRINYSSLLLNRILAPLIEFSCHSDDELYKSAKKLIDWSAFLTADKTFAIYSTVIHSKINHSKFASLRLKDAIVDHFNDMKSRRPSVDTTDPDVWINLHIQNNRAKISIDTSGGSLHRRGYKAPGHEAPMIETLGASIINYTEWKGEKPIVDPFCGSGTLLCEAFLKVTGTPPGKLRNRFGFENLPDFSRRDWEMVRTEENARIQEIDDDLIAGSDISGYSVTLANKSIQTISGTDSFTILKKDIFDIKSIENSIIVCNPPYGIRLSNANLHEFYRELGDFLKNKCKGSTAYIYFGEREYIKSLGLRTSMKKPLSNGKLDGRLVRLDLY